MVKYNNPAYCTQGAQTSVGVHVAAGALAAVWRSAGTSPKTNTPWLDGQPDCVPACPTRFHST